MLLQGMVLVKRSFIAEQLESYKDEMAAIATVKKQMDDSEVIAHQAFKAQLALQNKWKELNARCQSLKEEKAQWQNQNASPFALQLLHTCQEQNSPVGSSVTYCLELSKSFTCLLADHHGEKNKWRRGCWRDRGSQSRGTTPAPGANQAHDASLDGRRQGRSHQVC